MAIFTAVSNEKYYLGGVHMFTFINKRIKYLSVFVLIMLIFNLFGEITMNFFVNAETGAIGQNGNDGWTYYKGSDDTVTASAENSMINYFF